MNLTAVLGAPKYPQVPPHLATHFVDAQVLTCSWATQPPRALSVAAAAIINTTASGAAAAAATAALSVQGVSWSGAYRLVGSTDGQVRVEETGPAPRCDDVSLLAAGCSLGWMR